MCGIAGLLGFKGDKKKNIEAMTKQLYHRGPDAGDTFFDEKMDVALGHRRLAIIDLSDTGLQPMTSSTGRYVIVYNGEIYNADTIRRKLSDEFGIYSYKGTSDTEVFLHSIEQYGLKETLEMARGMFAFCVYDKEEHSVKLVRDRMGEKPLYYGVVNGAFVFASEITAIEAIDGFNNKIDKDVLKIYLEHGYIPAPYTIYQDIYKLEPGKILSTKYPFTKWDIETYYDIKQTAINGQNNLFKGTEQEATDELERLLKEAIKGQMIADVPIGAFLSGGVDSTLMVSLMQSLSENPIRTFTVGFEDEQYSEAKYALESAKHLGTMHTDFIIGYEDVMHLLGDMPKIFGEPFADSSQLPTLLVSMMTRKHVTVAISGDAGDEFYCGYNTYKDVQKDLAVMQSKLGFIKGGMRESLGNQLLKFKNPVFNKLHTAGECMTIKSAEEKHRLNHAGDGDVEYLLKNFTADSQHYTKNAKYQDGMLAGVEHNLMLMDMEQYLPDDILCKVDRSAMHYALETRIPFLDKDVMEFAWSLPLEYKMSDGITKKITRNILYKYIPKELMERPKKGFSVPVSKWLRDGKMQEWGNSIMSDAQTKASEFLNMDAVMKMWKHYQQTGEWNSIIWNILMLEQWFNEH